MSDLAKHLKYVLSTNSMRINVDDYKDYSHQDFVQHAIELRKRKGQHSEFYYVLDELVHKINQYKDKTKITRSIPKQESATKIRSSK